MNLSNINQAMINRANTQSEIKTINRRINDVINHINGVDVVFRLNELITGAIVSDLLDGINATWMNPSTIVNATIYEADVPSSYINNLRPSGTWKAHVRKNGVSIADTYTPLESFVRNADGSIMFSPMQPTSDGIANKNYGGNIQNIIM